MTRSSFLLQKSILVAEFSRLCFWQIKLNFWIQVLPSSTLYFLTWGCEYLTLYIVIKWENKWSEDPIDNIVESESTLEEFLIFLMCWGYIVAFMKSSYNLSSISRLNSLPPPFFISPLPHSWNSLIFIIINSSRMPSS
jgi:hypothetical protein